MNETNHAWLPSQRLTPGACIALLLAVAIGRFAVADTAPVVMPAPAKLEWRGEQLVLTGTIDVAWNGFRSPLLDQAVARMAGRLERRTAIPVRLGGATDAVHLVIECAADDPDAFGLRAREDYTLQVGAGGIRLAAPGPKGILYGLATLVQLVQINSTGFSIAGAYVEDRPRFAWRGLLIDVARHFVSVDGLKRQIDLMEMVKLNALHLHLSDAEGFRLESKSMPRLHEVGSFGQYYTQDEMRDIVGYAAARGIRIIPEFDMPAHTGSWLVAYPELAAGEIGKRPQNALAEEVMDPTNEALYPRLERFFDEMTALFPDRYVHIGGDEVNAKQWSDSPRIRRFKAEHHLADNRALQNFFTLRIRSMLASRGKLAVGWDEIIAGNPPRDMVVESWRSSTMTGRAVRRGYATLVSAGAYLDMLLPAEHLYGVDPADVNGFGIDPEDWRALRKLPDTEWAIDELRLDRSPPLTPEQAGLIIGGEAALWMETVTEEMLDMALWPRSAAYAERVWTPLARIDAAELPNRLVAVDRWLQIMGSQHYASQARMVARLALNDPGGLATLVEALEPAKYYIRWHAIHDAKARPQVFNELADAAFPESIATVRAGVLIDQIIASRARSRPNVDALRVLLMRWRDNDARVQLMPESSGRLANAALMSHDLAAIAALGLAALDVLETGKETPSLHDAGYDQALRRQLVWIDASANQYAANYLPQPPGEVFLPLARPIARLAAAARSVSTPAVAP